MYKYNLQHWVSGVIPSEELSDLFSKGFLGPVSFSLIRKQQRLTVYAYAQAILLYKQKAFLHRAGFSPVVEDFLDREIEVAVQAIEKFKHQYKLVYTMSVDGIGIWEHITYNDVQTFLVANPYDLHSPLTIEGSAIDILTKVKYHKWLLWIRSFGPPEEEPHFPVEALLEEIKQQVSEHNNKNLPPNIYHGPALPYPESSTQEEEIELIMQQISDQRRSVLASHSDFSPSLAESRTDQKNPTHHIHNLLESKMLTLGRIVSKTEQKLIGPKFNPKVHNHFFEVLKPYFREEHHQPLLKLIETGETTIRPLIFYSNGNKLAFAFRQLYDKGYIALCNKKELQAWIGLNFQYLYRDKIKRFSEDYTEKIISREGYHCNNPLPILE